jgi:protein-disulfide isomerase
MARSAIPLAPAPEPKTNQPTSKPPAPPSPQLLPTDLLRGNRDAPLTIIAYTDYACPACRNAEEVLRELRTQYGERLAIAWRDFPHLNRLTGSRALHVAARCARMNGIPETAWSFHDDLFRIGPNRTEDSLMALAERHTYDATTFRACLRATGPRSAAAAVDANTVEAERFGITATPAFFVNGVRLEESPTFRAFTRLLDRPQ